MNDPVKLPVRASLRQTFRWCRVIARRHLGLLLAYVVLLWAMQTLAAMSLPVVITLVFTFNAGRMQVLIGSDVIFGLIATFAALIIHNEVLRGPAGFDRATMGRMGARAIGYALDAFLILLAASLSTLLPVVAVGVLQKVVGAGPLVAALLSVASGVAGFLLAAAMASRLSLRLPSRSLGRPLRWSEVWRMGRGNTPRLMAGMLVPLLLVACVASALVVPVQTLAPAAPPPSDLFQLVSMGATDADFQMPAPPSWLNPNIALGPALFVSLVWSLAGMLAGVILCVFTSVAYGQLQDNLASETPGGPGY